MPARKLEGYVAASVLFIDIVGFSLLLLDEQHQQLEILQSIAQSTDAFKKAGNKVTPAPAGDGFALAFFNGYVPPLLCAIEISHALKGHSEIKVRMGLSQGPVKKIMDMSGRPNVSGDGIIDSQRVMDFGEAGHILVSKNLAAILLRMKDWESKLHYLGEARDKHNIIHYIYNYHDGEVGNRSIPKKLAAPTKPAAASPVTPPSISPAGKPPRKVPMFLPLPSFDADTFVRRDAELERLETCLIKGDNKVCCISVGDIPGGIGKTTLAHVFASKHKADFPDGIISVRVGKKSERELAQEFVSYCHSEERPHDAADATALMRRTFGDRRMLLIFDNAEESHNIRDLLPGGDKCAVIITTRRRDLGGALSIPLGNEIALGVFDDAQAKDLLGRLIGPERVREESAAADKIIKALSRLPLAIRIAGTTLQRGTAKYKTLNQYADDLRNKENILARHGSSSDPNLSLNASITLSLVALDNDEYTKFFLRLSACSEEGFSLTEALAANNYNENETDEVGKVMERLFDFALVNMTVPASSGADRFVLHSLIYLYAHMTAYKRAGVSGGDNLLAEAMWSHAEFYRSYFERKAANDSALATFLADEMDGIIMAARHWYGKKQTADANDLSNAILEVLDRQNRRKAIEFIYALLEVAHEMNDAEAEVNLRISLASRLNKDNLFGQARDELAPIERLIPQLVGDARLDCTARWKNTLAVALQHLNDLSGAETAIGDCIRARQEQGGGKNLAFAYNTQGIILDLRGKTEEALAALDKSIEIRKNDLHNLPISLVSKAKILRGNGADDEARLLIEQALAAFNRDHNSSGQAQALTEFGNALLEEGSHFFSDAMKAFTRAEEIERGNNPAGLAIVLTRIGTAYLNAGNDPARAITSLKEAFQLEEERHHAQGLIIVLRLLTKALKRTNRSREIEGYRRRALTTAPNDPEIGRLTNAGRRLESEHRVSSY